jgi:hypothetical protein
MASCRKKETREERRCVDVRSLVSRCQDLKPDAETQLWNWYMSIFCYQIFLIKNTPEKKRDSGCY